MLLDIKKIWNTFYPLIFSTLMIILVNSSAFAQNPSYNTRISLLYEQINKKLKDSSTGLYYEATNHSKNENKYSFLWPLCAYIQAANEMERITPKKNYLSPVLKAIHQYYYAKSTYPAYQAYVTKEKKESLYYDDNQWLAIALLDAYQNRPHKKSYLKISKMICNFMISGLDTVTGGGFYWREGDKTTKNTCSNGPGIIVLLNLYKITKDPYFLQTAIKIYNWVNKTLQSPDALFYDNIRTSDLQVNKIKYTYNTGTMLQSNVLLYEITKNKKYLNEAERIAKAGEKYFFKNGRLPNGYWFNTVLFRGYEALFKFDRNKTWINLFQKDADEIWKNERDSNNMLGTKPEKTLIDQAAMIEIYARLEKIKTTFIRAK